MKLADAVRRTAVAAACLTLTAGLVHPSGAPNQQSSERPLVVDFYALGADGVAVADLKPEEVTVRVNSRARALENLRLVKQSDVPPDDPLAAKLVKPPAPFATNGVAELGRSFVVVIDDESIRPGRERPMRAALGAFFGALSARDRVSLWTLPHGGMKVDLTTNHDRVSAALQIVVGHGPERESSRDGACRSRTALEALEHMLSLMAGGEGPTTVVYITNSLLGPRRDNPMTMAPGMCELQTEQWTKVGRAAAAARAHFYIVQPEDQMASGSLATENIAGAGFSGSDSPLEGIENLAGVTGGTRMSLTRGGDAALVQIAKATASFYSATIAGSSSDIEGPIALDVKVSRPGVTVRSRPLIFIRRAAGVAAKPLTPEEMIKVSTSYNELPIRISGYSTLNGDGRMLVISAAEPVDPNVKFKAMSAALFDEKGRLASLFNAADAELSLSPALTAMVVPPGAYRLRVAAVDAAGRAGAADTELVAEVVEAGQLKLSSLVLGLSRDGKFQPRLQFGAEPAAVAYVDVFGGKAGLAIGAIIEVAESLNGPALVVNRLSVESTPDASRFKATGALPLGALPPGDYVARAIIGINGEMYGRIVRSFRKVGQ